ncbi:glycosyltransferase [Microbacterium sp. CFH 31415]|uniref:glycosyltransferase family 2 protein n=1 Tax=Microbacterium sp. CFH 31415 TaxID=2921732 RepID=UPI0027E27E6D|nr:glycosyltransferase [Microbacterium sp. CFH 31415]
MEGTLPHSSPRRSLITVTFNSREALMRFWHDRDMDDQTEWIVVDNFSSDDSAALAETLGARVIRLPKNVGFSAANNAGLATARGDFIGFVNPDVGIDAAAIDRLEELARETGAVVGPQLLDPDGTIQPNGRGFPLLTAKIRNRLRGDDHRYLLTSDGAAPRPVVWLMGAAVFGTRATIDRIGGWDSRFFIYYEDSDIGLRAWHEGVRVLLAPTATATHGWARETSGKFRWMPWLREIASMAKFYSRYPEMILSHRIASRAHPAIARAVYPG